MQNHVQTTSEKLIPDLFVELQRPVEWSIGILGRISLRLWNRLAHEIFVKQVVQDDL